MPRAPTPPEVDVSVLVPVYQNAATLDELIDRLVATLDALPTSFEMIFVDDGSTDESFAILERRAAADPRVRPFALTRNFGSQAASCAACDYVRGRRVVHIDADLENFPEDIPRLLAELDRGFDFACGYRAERLGPWLTRRLPSMLVNAYVRRRTGTDIRDVGCGLRALDASLVRNLEAEGEARRLMTPVLLRRARRVVQVPVRHRPKAGRGGHSFFTLLGIVADYYLLTAPRPFLAGGLVALATLGAAVVAAAFGRGGVALTLAGLGVLGGVLALVGEYAQRLYVLAQGAPFHEVREVPGAPRDPAVGR